MAIIRPSSAPVKPAVGTLAALAVVGVLSLFVLFAPFVWITRAATPQRSSAILNQAQKTAEIMICQSELQKGTVPQFSSAQMPTWWSQHSKGLLLDKDVVYRVPESIVGKRVRDLPPDTVLLEASGPLVDLNFGKPLRIRVDGTIAGE